MSYTTLTVYERDKSVKDHRKKRTIGGGRNVASKTEEGSFIIAEIYFNIAVRFLVLPPIFILYWIFARPLAKRCFDIFRKIFMALDEYVREIRKEVKGI